MRKKSKCQLPIFGFLPFDRRSLQLDSIGILWVHRLLFLNHRWSIERDRVCHSLKKPTKMYELEYEEFLPAISFNF